MSARPDRPPLALAAAKLAAAQRAEVEEWPRTALHENFRGDSTAGTPQAWDACAAFGA